VEKPFLAMKARPGTDGSSESSTRQGKPSMRSPVYVGLPAGTHRGILRSSMTRSDSYPEAGAGVKSPLQHIPVWLPALFPPFFTLLFTVAPRKQPNGESERSSNGCG
jgi:hypothetical protein